MRCILTVVICFFCITGFCQTQATMNKNAKESYNKIDKELNEVYKTILSEYKFNANFIKHLKASQRIWITFRDAELKVKYPESEPGNYGSVNPMCISIFLEKLTNERIKTLKVWIDGIEEGDVCSGSIKIIEK